MEFTSAWKHMVPKQLYSVYESVVFIVSAFQKSEYQNGAKRCNGPDTQHFVGALGIIAEKCKKIFPSKRQERIHFAQNQSPPELASKLVIRF